MLSHLQLLLQVVDKTFYPSPVQCLMGQLKIPFHYLPVRHSEPYTKQTSGK